MKKFFIIFSILLLLVGINSISFAQQVTVTGVGDNKDEAVKEALRTAVEQVVGVYINSNTVVSNLQVELDKIYAASEGYVNDFRVLRTAYKGDKCHVQVRVDVDTEPNSKLLSDLQLTYLLDNPRIIVKVSGSRYAGICEAAIVSKLRDMGMDVVATKSNPQQQVSVEPDMISMQGEAADEAVDVVDTVAAVDTVDVDDSIQEASEDYAEDDFSSGVEDSFEEGNEENNTDMDADGFSEGTVQAEDGNGEVEDGNGEAEENDIAAQSQYDFNDEAAVVNNFPMSEQGKVPTLSDWGTDELDADLSSYTVRCMLSESSMNVTLPNFYVAGKKNKAGNNATGLFKGIINVNVDVVKNDTKSVIQQFYLTDTKIYNSVDIAKQMAVEGVSSQIANKVAEIFSHHASLVKSNK